MTDQFVPKIRQSFTHCIFLTPHLDDAVFSAGDLINTLQAASVRCSVFTFFTQAHTHPATLSARAFLHQSRSPSAEALFAARREEDARLLAKRGIDYRHFGLVDAMWRRFTHPSLPRRITGALLPELLHVYPTYRWHVGKGALHPDDPAPGQVAGLIHKLQTEFPNALFFGPIATGNHTDHRVVQQALFASSLPCVFWDDYPYSLKAKPDSSLLDRYGLQEISFLSSWEDQRAFILEYQTQVMAIFPDGVPQRGSETFFVPPSLDLLLG